MGNSATWVKEGKGSENYNIKFRKNPNFGGKGLRQGEAGHDLAASRIP
jgi:hypothetical protein